MMIGDDDVWCAVIIYNCTAAAAAAAVDGEFYIIINRLCC